MHDLQVLLNECKAELDALKIPYGVISDIEVNTTAKKRLGRCSQLPDKTYCIQISSRLLDSSIPAMAVKHTLMHELLHSVPGCMNHQEKWKQLANRVNRAYGYQIRRTSSLEERGLSAADFEVSKPEPKYRLQCSKCNHTYNYYRWCATLEHYQDCRCSKCGSKLNLLSFGGTRVTQPVSKRTIYRFTCCKCNAVYERTRKSKFTENFQSYFCGNCHSFGTLQKDLI